MSSNRSRMFKTNESVAFSFIQVPRALISDELYKNILAEAKILYGLLLGRMYMSQGEDWVDKDGYVFVYYSIEEIMETFHCTKPTAVKIRTSLKDNNLIHMVAQGQGKPHKIYPVKFWEK